MGSPYILLPSAGDPLGSPYMSSFNMRAAVSSSVQRTLMAPVRSAPLYRRGFVDPYGDRDCLRQGAQLFQPDANNALIQLAGEEPSGAVEDLPGHIADGAGFAIGAQLS